MGLPRRARPGPGRRLLAELEARAAGHGVRVLRLETNRSLVEAIRCTGRGYREVAAFNDEPYAHHWFEKHLPRDAGGDHGRARSQRHIDGIEHRAPPAVRRDRRADHGRAPRGRRRSSRTGCRPTRRSAPARRRRLAARDLLTAAGGTAKAASPRADPELPSGQGTIRPRPQDAAALGRRRTPRPGPRRPGRRPPWTRTSLAGMTAWDELRQALSGVADRPARRACGATRTSARTRPGRRPTGSGWHPGPRPRLPSCTSGSAIR